MQIPNTPSILPMTNSDLSWALVPTHEHVAAPIPIVDSKKRKLSQIVTLRFALQEFSKCL